MLIREQNNGTVRMDGSGLPFPMLRGFANSANVYWFVYGESPRATASLTVYYDDKVLFTVNMQNHPSRRSFRAVIPATAFTERGEYRYSVATTDGDGNTATEGIGKIRVEALPVPVNRQEV